MKLFFQVAASVIIFSFLGGCSTFQSATSTVSSTVSSMTSRIDEKQYANVPQNQKAAIPEAEGKLAIAEKKVKLAKEKVKYAELEYDKADNAKYIASLEYDIVRQEAIKKSGLDVKSVSGELIGDLKAKKYKAEADIIRLDGKMEDVNQAIIRLTDEIKNSEAAAKKKLAGTDSRDKAAAAVPEKIKADQPAKAVEPAPVKQPQEQAR